jgi:hypothetical protein
MWLNINQETFVTDVQNTFKTENVNITVPMRVAWMDANDNSIAPLEQTFSVNLITPYTEEVVENPCASAVATMKTGGNARDKEIAFTLSAADGEYQNRTI